MEPISNPAGTATSAAGTPSNGNATVDRVTQAAHNTIDRVAAKAGPAVEKLRSATNSAAQSFSARASDMSTLPNQWADTSRSYIRENPLTAVGLGVLAGIVIGKLSR